ncbi:questin oxidase family protein [Aspergillus homomorphus CBS 101889]|uniref:HypA-like protein n=1 Tax=Aspergillus homomorphus (strain CBS 101889) TaxID=1450537 RepID=A0A395HNH2_ASPHC|nr:hypA-like protein [Aspergillus homomorphus CBS 101889]RAL09166.1 hypA-like protein [Aspergillus homomorphus CBS 101889]
MATAQTIHLSPAAHPGIFSVPASDTTTEVGITEASARVASEILQDDLERHHVFFNDSGFHNHTVHHILSIYALGASPEEIRAAYERDKAYQREAIPVDEAVVASLADSGRFLELLGRQKHYSNFLRFFQKRIERDGVEGVLKEFLFKGGEDEVARAMLGRLFGGLVHPFIHLGFAIEFEQPAIVAEALAQTAVHEDWTGPMFFWPAEERAGGVGRRGEKSMLEILDEIRKDEKLAKSVRWEDGNKMRDGVLARAGEEMLKYAAEYTVSAEQLEEKVAEMINTVVYYTGAAQRPSKQIKFDFFYLHSLNSSIFFSKIISLPFLDTKTKLRLLEWKGRLDLMLYVSRGTPELYLDEITKYPTSHSWETIFAYCNRLPEDDGHLAKLVRALANGERACRPFENQRGWPVRGDMWLRIANMGRSSNIVQLFSIHGWLMGSTLAMDSTSDHDHHALWVRSTGFEEAWREFDGRTKL